MNIKAASLPGSDAVVSTATARDLSLPSTTEQDQPSDLSSSQFPSTESEEIRANREEDHNGKANFIASVKSVQEQIVFALAGSTITNTSPANPNHSIASSPLSSDGGHEHAGASSTEPARTNEASTIHATPMGKGGPPSASKNPTFADGTPRQRSKKPRNPRRRASTPHPIASSSSATGSNSTTPQTTPEKVESRIVGGSVGKDRGRYRPLTGAEDVEEIVEGAVAPKTKPRRRRRVFKGRKGAKESLEDGPDGPTTASEKSMDTDVPAVEQSLPAPEAFTMEIKYPAFQTTEILDFGPEHGQDLSNQAPLTDSSEPNPASGTIKEGKSQAEKSQHRRRRYRYRQIRPPKTLSPKPTAEIDKQPALQDLFERYGTSLTNFRRPYLQYLSMERSAREKDPNVDVKLLREEFRAAFKEDCQFDWPGHEIVKSPIDEYFVQKDGIVEGYVYDPTAEAATEFQRLAIMAKWINGTVEWDVSNWDASLEKFEKLWSSKAARTERRRFKDACFEEFDQVFSHLTRFDCV